MIGSPGWIGSLIEASAKHRGLVLFAGLALGIGGVAATQAVDVDAIPDLSETQVIVFSEWMGRSPTLMEDQVTYPLVTALLGTPRVVDVRAQTMFGMSFVYAVFQDGTDLYWARSRVLEVLGTVRSRLPPDATTRLGPDATGIGWVYQYALVDRSGQGDLGALRATQDFSLKYALATVPGVAEVATVGGFEPQYQVTVDPLRLRTLGLSVGDVAEAIRRSNRDVGGRVIEASEREHFVRGRGYIRGRHDLEAVVLKSGADATPILVRDVARVSLGGNIRRGAADLDGLGETVSAIIVMRQGENAVTVIDAVKAKLAALKRTLPAGVEIVTVYDRSDLIERAIDTLRDALLEEMLVVALAIIIFLLHLQSALLPIVSLPLAVVIAFIPMFFLGVPATIMSLGGIAIAIGATVDAEIVMVEAAHKKLEHAPPDLPRAERERLLAAAAREVTPAIFFSLLIIAVSFVPVFGLSGQAGKLFRPLAYTKTFVMLSAALLSVTVAPALRDYLIRGRIRAEERHPISRAIRRVYEPFVHVALRNPKTTLLIGLMAVLSALPLVPRLGSEFMPPLDEGDILYMPTTLPNISIEEAKDQLQRQDAVLKSFPEVERVLGKIGRAETATDPAPLSMVETMVKLAPKSRWRPGLTREQLVAEMNAAMQFAGWRNAFTQPIRNRVDMLTTGIKTPVGIKVYGPSLAAIEGVGLALERVLQVPEGGQGGVPGTRGVFFERASGGLYVDIVPEREALARYGLAIEDVDEVIESALGGVTLTTAVDGPKRYAVNVRYASDFRADVERVREVMVPVGDGAGATGAQVPLGALAEVRVVEGPPMIRDEGGRLAGNVYVDVAPERDIGSYVAAARAAVDAAVKSGALLIPEGVDLRWTGQYELMAETEASMKVLIPITLGVTLLLLYLLFKSFTEALIVILSVPFALVGSVWALFLLDYHVSAAVAVGVIALVGLAAQTGVVMIVYIDQAYRRRLEAGEIRTLEDIIAAHAEGTIQRVRPKLMTVATMLIGLVPLLWASGSGADVMKRIAAPMVGGLVTSTFLTLELIPVIYTYWRNEQLWWRRLESEAPRTLAWLRRWAATMQLSAALALVAGLAPWYGLPPELHGVALGAGGAFVLALLAYFITRRRRRTRSSRG